MITCDQIRMGRSALKWTAQQLADKSKVTVNTIRRVENGANTTAKTLLNIQGAFEGAGIEFIPKNGGGVGVRFKSPPEEKG